MPFSSLKQLFSSLFFSSPPKTLTIFDIMSGRDKENSSPIVKGIEHTVVTYLKSQLWQSLSSTSSASQDARDNRSLYKVLDVSLYKVQASLNSYHEYIQAKRIPPCDSHYKHPVPGEPVPPTEQFIYVRMERTKERQDHLINVVDGLQSSDPDIVRVSCEMIFNARNTGPLAAFRKDRFADARNTPVYRKFMKDLENETPGAPIRAFNSPQPVNHGSRHSRSSSSRSSGSPSKFSGSPGIADRSGLELFASIFAPLSSSSSPTDGRDVVNFVGERPPTSDTLIHSLNVEPYDFTLLDLGLLAFEIHRADPLYSLFKHQCYWWAAMFIGVIQADIAANHRDRPQPQPLKFDPSEEESYNLENVPEASKAIKQQLAALPATTDNNIEPEPEPEPVTNPHLQSTYRKLKIIGPHHTMIRIIYERFKFSRGNLKQTLDGFSAEYKAEEDGRKAEEDERQRKEENGRLQLEEERRQKEEERRQKEEERHQKEEQQRQNEEERRQKEEERHQKEEQQRQKEEERRQKEEERRQKEEERRQKEELQERNRKLEEELRRLNSLMGSDKQNR
ncbi:hypothetical protein M413DRAFT_438796 [Hebeloma cylindrosporum]|uniref:Uncharacterized protein n=1 Tax=Hebeloma cylindrosporum TaxID=76867 RepID=A0A0C2Z936_HEBCY|nr:hypothetical protein M413DRAFT_438796 [Hebeloma cylindrosporum h7]